MFTGIIESIGVVKKIITTGTNKSFWLESPLSHELKVDQSLSHSGVCLTIEAIENKMHKVTAIDETLKKSSLDYWKEGTQVNLERCLQMNGRLDGHMVQGHVDAIGTCINVIAKDGSWEFGISYPEKFAFLLIEKGSISLNGISLTAFNVTNDSFTVAIIPYTFEHTNLKSIGTGDVLNLEFDMVGKYLQRHVDLAKIT